MEGLGESLAILGAWLLSKVYRIGIACMEFDYLLRMFIYYCSLI